MKKQGNFPRITIALSIAVIVGSAMAATALAKATPDVTYASEVELEAAAYYHTAPGADPFVSDPPMVVSEPAKQAASSQAKPTEPTAPSQTELEAAAYYHTAPGADVATPAPSTQKAN